MATSEEVMDNPVPDLVFEQNEEEPEVILVNSEDEIPKDEPAEGPDQELINKMAELQRQADSATALNNVAESLKTRQESPPVPPKAIADIGDIKKRMNKELFGDDPSTILDEYLGAYLQKNQPGMGSGNQNNVQMAKMIMKRDPIEGEFLKKHEVEVDALLATASPTQMNDPRIVEQAINMVKSQHIDEIIAEKVAEQLGNQPAVQVRKQPNSANTFTEGSGGKPARKKVYKVPTDLDRKQAELFGMTIDKYMQYKK